MSVYVETYPEKTMWFFTLFIGVDDSRPSEDMSHDKVSDICVHNNIQRPDSYSNSSLKPTVL